MSNKRALLVVAHGSRRTEANEEFKQQVEAISRLVPHQPVIAAFLELAQPSILTVIDKLAAQNCTELDIFPLFLNAGRHVQKDIPSDIAEAINKHPDIEINLLDYLGKSEQLPGLVAELINQSQ